MPSYPTNASPGPKRIGSEQARPQDLAVRNLHAGRTSIETPFALLGLAGSIKVFHAGAGEADWPHPLIWARLPQQSGRLVRGPSWSPPGSLHPATAIAAPDSGRRWPPAFRGRSYRCHGSGKSRVKRQVNLVVRIPAAMPRTSRQAKAGLEIPGPLIRCGHKGRVDQ